MSACVALAGGPLLPQASSFAADVDRSFLLEAQKPGGKALMAAIVGVARAVGAETVAEGIETVEQLALVRSILFTIAFYGGSVFIVIMM